MKHKFSKSRRGVSIPELLVAAVLGGFAMAAVFSGIISIQRCIAGGQDFGDAKLNQMRLSDFLSMDLRRALTVTKVNDGTTLLKLTIADFYDASGQPRTPTLTKYVAHYNDPTASVEIVYYKSGGSVFRREGSGVPMEIAKDVADFVIDADADKQVAETNISFASHFQRSTSDSTAAHPATTVSGVTVIRNKRKDIPN